MDDELLQSRLSQIATRWTLINDAHGERPDAMGRAQRRLLEQYQKPIYRYLVASLGSADAADEVMQEFALRFLKGGFRGASPERGRFRNYLKTALGRLVIDYRRRAHRERGSEHSDMLEPYHNDSEAGLFDNSWRSEVLNRVWVALERFQEKQGNAFYAVLKYRAEHPDAGSQDMAAALTQALQPQRPFTADWVRQTLRRSREKFADLLLDEIALSLGSADLDLIERELVELELLPYCRVTLQKRRNKP